MLKWIEETEEQNTKMPKYVQDCIDWLKNKNNVEKNYPDLFKEPPDLFIDFLPYRLLGGYSEIKTFLSKEQFQRRIKEIKHFIEARAKRKKITYCLNDILSDLNLDNDLCNFVKSFEF